MLKNKKVIIFDMDGTLIDSIGIWNEVDVEMISRLKGEKVDPLTAQKERDEALRFMSKKSDPYEEYCISLGKKCSSPLSSKELVEMRTKIASDFLKNKVHYKLGADKILKYLKDLNYTLIIATTTKKVNMDIYLNENKNIITLAPLEEYFDRIYTKEDAKEMKPSPEIYYTIMKELCVNPSECLVFEDSLVGIEASSGAGIETVIMYDKFSDDNREKINELASYCFDTFYDVLDYIK